MLLYLLARAGAMALVCSTSSAEQQRVSAPAPALETIPGAFGVRFGAPVPGRVIIAPTTAPSISINAGLRAGEPPQRTGVPPRWRSIAPPTIPPLLKDRGTSSIFGALLDDGGAPVRIVAVVPATDCLELYARVSAILEQRYGPGTDPDASAPEALLGDSDAPASSALVRAAPATTRHGRLDKRGTARKPTAVAIAASAPIHPDALFTIDGNQVQVSCRGTQLVLDYLDGVAYPIWQRAQRERIAQFDRRVRLAVSEQIAPAKNNVIEAAFGVRLGVPLALPGALPDILAQLHPPQPFGDWPNATYEVMLDPAHVPIRIVARTRLRDGPAAFAEKARLVGALTERYGQPIKDGPRHTVISSAGRLAVVDASADNQVILMFVDNDRLQRQRIRFDIRRQDLAAQSERQRATEQAGF